MRMKGERREGERERKDNGGMERWRREGEVGRGSGKATVKHD